MFIFYRDRIWSLLEYLSGLKYLTGRCLQHAFLEDVMEILSVAESSLQLPSASADFSQKSDGRMVSGRTEAETDAFNRLQIVKALRRKINESRISAPK